MRLRYAAGAGVFLLVGMAGPASAQGLFDLLMGGAAMPGAQAPVGGGTLTVHRRQARPRSAAPRVAHTPARPLPARAEADAARHKPETAIDPSKVADWYLHDRTLRRGDIVVLKSGVLVFKGRGGETRRAADFARLHEARFLPARTRDFVARATAANAHAAAVVAPPKPKVRPSAT